MMAMPPGYGWISREAAARGGGYLDAPSMLGPKHPAGRSQHRAAIQRDRLAGDVGGGG